MANSKIFASTPSTKVAQARNQAGGAAYALSDKGALAQLAATGVFADTFYASAETQMALFKQLVDKVEPTFLAKLAVYIQKHAYMKDTPAYLLAVLATKDTALFSQVFSQVVHNGKMLRNFVQIVRSGVTGRRSLGTRPKKLVAEWLTSASVPTLLAASVGNQPSLADVIKLAHPRATSVEQEALFAYLVGRKLESEALLPRVVQQLLKAQRGLTGNAPLPAVPFELLTGLAVTREHWTQIAMQATWQQLRMNLNTFARHGVFQSREVCATLATKLGDAEEVAKARVFPYQIMAAYLNLDPAVPVEFRHALQDALEHSVVKVPRFKGEVAVLADVSGSMTHPVTGSRGTATTKVRCLDVAALMASIIVKANPTAQVLPFDTRVHPISINSRDSVATNAERLSRFSGSATNCACALRELNARGSVAECVIYVSDNESWVNTYRGRRHGTETMREWAAYKRRVPKAKLVCIDVTPEPTTQALDRPDILNIGGFSDSVLEVMSRFFEGKMHANYWVHEIEKIEL